MKASIVYNKEDEPRVLIQLENQEERSLFRHHSDLKCIKVVEENDVLVELAYERQLDDSGPEVWKRLGRGTVCDVCGDNSNSEPGIPCGRIEPESWDGPCPGTYVDRGPT